MTIVFYWKRPCFGGLMHKNIGKKQVPGMYTIPIEPMGIDPGVSQLSPWSAEATDFFAELRKSPPKVRIVRKPRGDITIYNPYGIHCKNGTFTLHDMNVCFF